MTRGRTRPPMMNVSAKGEVVVPPESTASRPPVPLKSDAPARPASASPLPRLASNPSVPKGPLPKIVWDENPQFEFTDEIAMQRAVEEAAVKRRREALRVWRIVAAAVVAVLLIGLVNEAVGRLFDKLPPAGLLAARSQETGQLVLRIYDKPEQPLAFESAQAVLFDHEAARRAVYDVVATLRLRAELYARADSNGAQPYLQLQQSLAEARAKVLKHSLFVRVPTLRDAPEMPQLLALTHHAGEKLVVKVPFTATRSGWTWQVGAANLTQRRTDRRLTGEALARFGPEPFIIFSATEGREVMHQKMADARRYIIAVNSELARRGLSE